MIYKRKLSKDNAMLYANLRKLQGGRTGQQMAIIIGAKCENTWYSRMRNPDKITIRELRKICEACGSTPDRVLSGDLF